MNLLEKVKYNIESYHHIQLNGWIRYASERVLEASKNGSLSVGVFVSEPRYKDDIIKYFNESGFKCYIFYRNENYITIDWSEQ